MLNNFDYLWKRLLCVCVCVCVNSTLGKCCPCGKDKEKKTKEKKEEEYEKKNIVIEDNKKFDNIIYNNEEHLIKNNLENEFINNVDNEEPLEKTTKIKETTNMSTNPIENQNDDKKNLINNGNNEEALVNKYTIELLENQNDDTKNLINQIIVEALNNNVICDGCKKTKNSESKIKLVFTDPVLVFTDPDVGASKKPSLKTVELEFGFCKNHKKCIGNWGSEECQEEAEYLFQCGHKKCKTHWKEIKDGKRDPFAVFCEKCKMWSWGDDQIEGFGTHLLCSTYLGMHLVCYKDNDDENPYKKNDHSYKKSTWLCPEHKKEKRNNTDYAKEEFFDFDDRFKLI